MWRGRDRTEVTCIACGAELDRSDAREYDKHGDRWEREGKEFEHLCKPCYRDLCHQPRSGLEAALLGIETTASRTEFLRQFHDAIDAEPADGEQESGQD